MTELTTVYTGADLRFVLLFGLLFGALIGGFTVLLFGSRPRRDRRCASEFASKCASAFASECAFERGTGHCDHPTEENQ